MSKITNKDVLTFKQKLFGGEFALMSKGELYRLLFILLAIIGVILWVLFSKIEPPPQKNIKILTGSSSGAYFAYGKRYAEALKVHGIKLEVVQTAGSVENLQKMLAPEGGFHAALIQSGIATEKQLSVDADGEPPKLESLSSVSFEPVWVFYKPKTAQDKINGLDAFRGKHIAIGAEGSGTRVVAQRLLSSVSIDATTAKFSPNTGTDAVKAVLKGELDAVFLVAAATAESVQLALNSGLRPVNYERADAYVRLNPWLTKVTLPRGVVNMSKDLPDEDLVLVAATANLVVQRDLHPAVSFLLMEIAAEIHRAPTILNNLKDFPSEKSLDFPQSEESKRYFKNGRPFLQRYLPFWLANLGERLLVTLVPLLAILLPALQIIPKLVRWFGKSRLLKMYDRVRLIEHLAGNTPESKQAALVQIDELEAQVNALPPDSDLFVDTYNLRAHFDVVRNRLAG
jgi:TRAP transporter TAXI family solute receptor